MSVREFDEAELPRVVALWNQCLPMDMLNEAIFRERILLDENFDRGLLLCAEENGRIIGFGYGMKRKVAYYTKGLEPENGWICILFVAPDCRRRGVGTQLCQGLEDRLRQKGASQIILGSYSPHYFVPGVDCTAEEAMSFFTQRGYLREKPCFSMRKILQGYQIPEEIQEKHRKMEADGFRFTGFLPKYEASLRRFLAENFTPGWYRNVEILLREKKGEAQIYLCVSPEDHVIGFCMRGMDNSPNRFGPFGVAEQYRNHALGSVLFCSVLHDYACQGIYFIYFLSTDTDGRRFYERHGMECFREFFHMRKQL